MGRQFRLGDWSVFPDLNKLSRGETTIQIEPKVMDVLVCLAAHGGEVLSREKIIQTVWPGTYVSDEVLTYSISELRRAFEDDAKNPTIIQTIPRRGYRLIAPVTEEAKEIETPAPAPAPAAVVPAPLREGPRASWRLAIPLVVSAGALVGLIYWIFQSGLFVGQPSIGRIVLAVLPFENLSGDPEQEYFSDGLTEELITRLGSMQSDQLRVIARTSAMKYKDQRAGADQIGRELGANYILEGSVRKEGARVRVNAKLVQVRDQTQLWADVFDRELSGILALQNEVAEAVAGHIRITLSERERLRLARSSRVVPEAHEAYLRGRFLWNRRTPADFARAVEYFKESLKWDSGYAPAYSGLADTYLLLTEYADASPDLSLKEAKPAALKALALDPDLAEAHASAGLVLTHEWKWPEAEKEFQQANRLNPSYVTAHHWYATLLSSLGRFEDAAAEIQRAVELDALSPVARAAMAWRVYAWAHQYDRAIVEARAALELDPNYDIVHRRLGILYLLTGRSADAVAEVQKGVAASDPTPFALADLGYAYAAVGNKKEAEKILDALAQRAQRQYVDATRFALIHIGLGQKDRALDWLEYAQARHAVGLLVIGSDPRYETLVNEERFKQILRSMGLRKSG